MSKSLNNKRAKKGEILELNAAEISQIEALAVHGHTQQEISNYLGFSDRTFRNIQKRDEDIFSAYTRGRMSAPRKVRKNQLVRIQPMQSLTNSIEATIALQEVTNVMKPIEATYQAATQVKVLSSEIPENIEADVFHCAEGSMKGDAMVSHHSLYRSLSPWHDMRWSLRKLGRSSVFSKEYVRTSQNRQGLANGTEEVGLTDSTRSMGKLCTWGSGQQWKAWLSTSHNNTLRL